MSADGSKGQGPGLANALSNVFKLADVNGLCWVRYLGPNSLALERPRDDPVLKSYARLLNEGYACAWRRLSPSMDGLSGEAKDLWVFFFSDLPNISTKLAEGLQQESRGCWSDGMSPESSTMLYRSLHNLIERSLLTEGFLPLGKWFARPDSSVITDGSSRGCFLCSFSFFVHAHLYICASVDMRAGPGLQPLLPAHVNQALASSTGLQVILSPSGLNAVMTGHSYKASEAGIEETIQEWKLFFPRRFSLDPSPVLPAAIEVLLGGVRLRYPSQFVLVHHSSDQLPSPPPSPIAGPAMEGLMEDTWDASRSTDPLQRYKEISQCSCQDALPPSRSHSRRPSGQLDLPLKSNSPHGRHHPAAQRSGRHEPYPRPAELATPTSLSLLSIPALQARKQHTRHALPRYTTPLDSPSLPPPSLSSASPAHQALKPSLPPPTFTITSDSTATTTTSDHTFSVASKTYDPSRVTHLPKPTTLPAPLPTHHSLSQGWWDALHLPDSMQSLAKLQAPRVDRLPRLPGCRSDGFPSPLWAGSASGGGAASTGSTLSALLSPTSRRGGSPVRLGKNSESLSATPTSATPTSATPTRLLAGPPLVPVAQRGASMPRGGALGRGRGRGRKGSGAGLSMLPEEGEGGGADGSGEGFGMPAGERDEKLTGADGMLARPSGLDMLSESVVKITELDQIFDEDEDSQPSAESTHFFLTSAVASSAEDRREANTTTKTTKMATSDAITLSDLSRIYPTPPSVEAPEGRYDDVIKTAAEDRAEQMLVSEPAQSDEAACVPPDFAPLPNLQCFQLHLPPHCVFTPATPTSPEKTSSSELESWRVSGSLSEPQKFIFPPPSSLALPLPSSLALPLPSSLALRALKIESLSLPLSSRRRLSPHLPTFPTLSSSPYPPKGPARFYRPLSATPLESPYPATPTPLSAGHAHLMPVLPEAHALYISLALLDSALGANLSETLAINTGPIMSTIQSFFRFNSRRLKLDSSSMDPVAMDTSRPGSTSATELVPFQDEKPLMTFGAAEYPSLGFREELGGVVGVASPSTDVRGWMAPYGALSKFLEACSGPEGGGQDATSCLTGGGSFPVETFLELLQDYCLHLCFSGCQGNEEGAGPPSSCTHLMLRATKGEGPDKLASRLYHSHDVVSAILAGKHLASEQSKVAMATPASASSKPAAPVSLEKGDNSASWILQLLHLPTKFVSKRLRELRSVFHNSFHQAPCLKFTTRGPLTLKDLQSLTPSQTALGDECSPLPMQPVVVGYDHEWVSVSPLALPAWDKMLFEPYAMSKTAMYLVLVPSPPSPPSPPSLMPTLRKYFRDLSITFKNCHLGQHVPLDKGLAPDAIVLTPPVCLTDSPAGTARHGYPEGLAEFKRFCKKTIVSFLSSIPVEGKRLSAQSSHHTEVNPLAANTLLANNPAPPISIVLYIICNEGRSSRAAFQLLHTFTELVSSEDIPQTTRNRIILQILDKQELFGLGAGHSGQLRSLAFSVYARSRPCMDLLEGSRNFTSFGPTADKIKQLQRCPQRRLNGPPFILSQAPRLGSLGPLIGGVPQNYPILFGPEEAVLFCGYCVSPDQRWLLVVCCDRQGELLDTAVIGIQPSDMDSSRLNALQELWQYLVAMVAATVFKWSIIVTRFGKPSSSEIRDWPKIVEDGLLEANQYLRGNECSACGLSQAVRPHLSNVLVLAVQPETHVQLFPSADHALPVSHVMVLPQDPRAEHAGPSMTPSAGADAVEEFEFGFTAADATGGGDMGLMDPGLLGDLDKHLSTMEFIDDDLRGAALPGVAQGGEDAAPKATGYLISTCPPGSLPDDFWGHSRPHTHCSMFKVLLHCHRSEKAWADSPQETLGSVLLCFDALSWLTIDHASRQRRSCLPIHLSVLSRLHHLFSLLDTPPS